MSALGLTQFERDTLEQAIKESQKDTVDVTRVRCLNLHSTLTPGKPCWDCQDEISAGAEPEPRVWP